jgi:hypothetical protein
MLNELLLIGIKILSSFSMNSSNNLPKVTDTDTETSQALSTLNSSSSTKGFPPITSSPFT